MPFDSPKGIELVEGFDIGIIDAAHGVKKETYQERLIRINEEIDKILEDKGSILFPGNPYGKFVEYVGLLRRDYRDKVFAFHTSVYGEVLHFIEDRELLEMLISNKENNKVFDQFSELEEDEVDIWITPVVGCHLKGYQTFIDDFMRREENRVILLTKQCYHKTEDNFDWIKKNQAKVSKYSLKPHQDIEGVERLLNEKNFKQVILCHAKESAVCNVAESLNKKGYDYVKIAHIKDTINF